MCSMGRTNRDSSGPFSRLPSHRHGPGVCVMLSAVVILSSCFASLSTALDDENGVPVVSTVSVGQDRQKRFMDLFFDGMKYAGDILEKNKAAAAKPDGNEPKQLSITVSRSEDDEASKTHNNTQSSSSTESQNSTTSFEPPIKPFGFAVATRGEDLAAKLKEADQPASSKQIFPFNPFVAYGPFMSIPLWILVGMYSKLLAKTKEFYSTGYRIDFWKKKPYGLKGYYLHPAYYPVEEVPTTTTARTEVKEEHHDPWWGGEETSSWGEENTYGLDDKTPLYADEDTSLPPLPDDEEHLQNVGEKVYKKAKDRRMHFPLVGKKAYYNKKLLSSRKNDDNLLAKRVGSPAVGHQQPTGVSDTLSANLPWGTQTRRVYSAHQTRPTGQRSHSNSGEMHFNSNLQVTTWRPPFGIRSSQPAEANSKASKPASSSTMRTTRYNHGA